MKPFPILLCLMSFLGCKAADFRSVDAETFAKVIEDTTVIRLDVRTANEYAQGHIPNALLIDVTQADFIQKAEQLLPAGGQRYSGDLRITLCSARLARTRLCGGGYFYLRRSDRL